MDKLVSALNEILESQKVFNVAVNDVEMSEQELRAIIRNVYETARVAVAHYVDGTGHRIAMHPTANDAR